MSQLFSGIERCDQHNLFPLCVNIILTFLCQKTCPFSDHAKLSKPITNIYFHLSEILLGVCLFRATPTVYWLDSIKKEKTWLKTYRIDCLSISYFYLARHLLLLASHLCRAPTTRYLPRSRSRPPAAVDPRFLPLSRPHRCCQSPDNLQFTAVVSHTSSLSMVCRSHSFPISHSRLERRSKVLVVFAFAKLMHQKKESDMFGS